MRGHSSSRRSLNYLRQRLWRGSQPSESSQSSSSSAAMGGWLECERDFSGYSSSDSDDHSSSSLVFGPSGSLALSLVNSTLMLSECIAFSFYLLSSAAIALSGNCRHPIPSICPKPISLKLVECFSNFIAESTVNILLGLLFVWPESSLLRRQQKRLWGTPSSLAFSNFFLISCSRKASILLLMACSQMREEMLAMFSTNFPPRFSLSSTTITKPNEPVCPIFTILRNHLQIVIESHSPRQLSVGLSYRYSLQFSLKWKQGSQGLGNSVGSESFSRLELRWIQFLSLTRQQLEASLLKGWALNSSFLEVEARMECRKSERQRLGSFWITASFSFCSQTTASSSRLDWQGLVMAASRGSRGVNLYYNFIVITTQPTRSSGHKFMGARQICWPCSLGWRLGRGSIILLMERLKRKELEALRAEKERVRVEEQEALKHLIRQDEQLQIRLRYIWEWLKRGETEGLAEYSPTQISRLVFEGELKALRNQLQKLPSGEARAEYFIVSMLQILRCPFERSPHLAVGLREMWQQVTGGKGGVSYPSFFRYVLGELVSLKEEQQNTEFQVQLQERKKQDYLLHDNGIKRIRYSKDLRVLFSLDLRANSIRLYDADMKGLPKFTPKKEKHGNKFPLILDFDYSEIQTRLGIVLADSTISTVHVPNLLAKLQPEFDSGPLNEVVFPLPVPMKAVFYLQMVNRWLTVAEGGLQLYLFDLERVKSQPEKVMQRVALNVGQQPITSVLEVVTLSCVCVVAGNQVNFYNQSLTSVRFVKFCHVQKVGHLRYSEEKNQFYLCGKQKALTIFSIGRNSAPSKLWTLPLNKIVRDFQVFPHFDTIVIADESHQIRLLHESSRSVYQTVNYGHIVKSKEGAISIAKLSKTEFSLYQTYQIVVCQQKIAIERGLEYSFLQSYYLNPRSNELYLSVNNQIIAFSLLSGEMRKSFSPDSSNLEKHIAFFMGGKTPLFVLEHSYSVYEIYEKSEEGEGQNHSYRKKVGGDEAVACFYDEDMQNMMIVGRSSLTQVRNESNNCFNILNGVIFDGFQSITKASFCTATKTVTFLTADQLLYQLKNYEALIESCMKFIFPGDTAHHEQAFLLNFQYDSGYDTFVVLTSKNEVYFYERRGRQLYFDICEHLPTKLKHLKFTSMSYQLMEEKRATPERYILLTDDTGFIMQFSLSSLYEKAGITIKNTSSKMKPMFKEPQIVTNIGIQIQQIELSQAHRVQRSYKEVGLMKAHEKAISLAIRAKVEIGVTITIAIDGYVRMWDEDYALLFSLKIPSLVKIVWNMKPIEEIKNYRSLQQLLKIFEEHYSDGLNEQNSPLQTCLKSKRLKNREEIPRININEPIRIDIENKDIEELVMQREEYSTGLGGRDKARTQLFFHNIQKTFPHPWRTRREFVKIYERASPPNKYNKKMPQELMEMRSSLDMTEKIKPIQTFKEAELILPQLSFYEPEKTIQSQRKKPEPEESAESGENFQSCLYVRSERKKKKVNELDEIDKEFKKKEMVLTARKWVPKKRKERNNSVLELKSELGGGAESGKADPLRAIQKIFEQHNRQCMETKKGRMIKIPKISLNRDFY